MRYRSAFLTVLTLLAFIVLGGGRAAAQESLPADIIGSEWSLVSLQTAPGAVEDTTGKGITIQFDSEGKISGSGGCNRFFGGYTAAASQQLTLSQIGSTMMACETDISTREAAYFKALESVSSYALSGSTLTLSFDNGQGALTFTKGATPTLPVTGGESDNTAGLLLFGLVCCAAGFWFVRRTNRQSQGR